MANKTVKSVSLFFQVPPSNKEYHVQLVEGKSGEFLVNFQYGRIGNTLQTGTKTLVSVSERVAEQIYDKLVKEKTAKGYIEGATKNSDFR